jgi:hypothetical protein
MKKLTAKQKKAIGSLVCMLDELSNKPRRLFDELRNVSNVFLSSTVEQEHLSEILSDIDEWESDYYKKYSITSYIQGVANKCKEIKKKLLSRTAIDGLYQKDASYISGYEDGVTAACEITAKEIIIEALEELY